MEILFVVMEKSMIQPSADRSSLLLEEFNFAACIKTIKHEVNTKYNPPIMLDAVYMTFKVLPTKSLEEFIDPAGFWLRMGVQVFGSSQFKQAY